VPDLTAADDNFTLGSFGDGVTVTSAWCNYYGTGTTPATINLEDSDGNKMTMSDMTCAVSTSEATAQAVTAANQLIDREVLQFDVTNTPAPTTDDYVICFSYSVDAT